MSQKVHQYTTRYFASHRLHINLSLPCHILQLSFSLCVCTHLLATGHEPTGSTQPCIPLGSLNRVPALTGWGKGGNVTSAGWQVILCDPIWHVSSRSSEAFANCYTRLLYFTYTHADSRCRFGWPMRRVLLASPQSLLPPSQSPLPTLCVVCAMLQGFALCPYCYSHPPFREMKKGMCCNECTHPSCPNSLAMIGVSACVECDSGTLVLDLMSAPKWRIVCNRSAAPPPICDVHTGGIAT